MKKLLAFLLPLLSVFAFVSSVQADQGEFRVGMEAGYPPFNWTQKTDANGAVKIDGSDQYANGYDVQIAKKIADKLDKSLLLLKLSGMDLYQLLHQVKSMQLSQV